MQTIREHFNVFKKYVEKKGELSMKKLSMLILLVIVASLLVAAIPTKMMRLTIINKSGYDVYMKLEGSPVTEGYYYLTVPAGDRDEPMIKVFTVQGDLYKRTTWQCGGLENTGDLVVDGNIRLTFLPCAEAQCWRLTTHGELWGCEKDIPVTIIGANYNQGEPRMEKVTYWKYFVYAANWPKNNEADGYWNFGCVQYWWDFKTYKLPLGCNFRYQY